MRVQTAGDWETLSGCECGSESAQAGPLDGVARGEREGYLWEAWACGRALRQIDGAKAAARAWHRCSCAGRLTGGGGGGGVDHIKLRQGAHPEPCEIYRSLQLVPIAWWYTSPSALAALLDTI